MSDAIDDRNNELRKWGFAKGGYISPCGDCGKYHEADKRATRCMMCAERRADLPATDAQVMANEKVRALVEAVIHERNLVCQDIDMQISASNAVESALAALEVKG